MSKKVIGFHKPEEPNGYLSNWYMSDFEIEGQHFTSMEQYMMYSKAITFGDSEIAKQILATSDAGKVKALGRAVKNYSEPIWNGTRQIVVYNGLLAKFEQNESLKEQLIATGDMILAECAVSDLVWGIGLPMHTDDKQDLSKWRGQNLLGFTLMQVREKLR